MGVILPREFLAEYQRVEWIAGATGSPYIDSGYAPNNNSRVKIVGNNNAWQFMVRKKMASLQFCVIYTAGNTFRSDYGNGGISDNPTGQKESSKQDNFGVDEIVTVDKNKNVTTISSGTRTVQIINDLQTFQCDRNLLVNTNNQETGVIGRIGRNIYSYAIWDDGMPVRDYVPCYRKADREPGMYDLVSGTFFTNAGTGEFIVGPDVHFDNRSLLALRRQIVNTQPHKMTVVGTNGIATFETNFEELMKVSAPFTPVQDLHGMPYPYPAGGSVNLIPDTTDTENGYVDGYYLLSDGSTYTAPNHYISEYFTIDESTTYTWSNRINASTLQAICFYDENKDFISGIAIDGQYSHTFVPPEGTVYCRSSQAKDNAPSGAAFQLEVGSTATAYRRHSNICPIEGFCECNIDNYRNLENSITFAATQSGLGDPSPENYRQINPGLVFTRDDNTELVVYCGSLAFSDGVWTLKATHKYLEYDGVTAGKKFEYSGSVGKNYYNVLDDGYLYGASTGSWITPAQLENYGYLVSNLTIMNGAPAETDHPVHNVYNGSKRVLQPRISFPSSIDSLNAGNAQLKAWYDDGKPYAICYRLKTSVSYVLSDSEARRALIALGLIRGINVTFSDPSTGDPMTVYGGTLTLNEDGSADLVQRYREHKMLSVTLSGGTVHGDTIEYIFRNAGNTSDLLSNQSAAVCDCFIDSSDYKPYSFAMYKPNANGNVNFYFSFPKNVSITDAQNLLNSLQPTFIAPLMSTLRPTYHFDNVGQLKSFIGQNNVLTDLNGDPTVVYWERG